MKNIFRVKILFFFGISILFSCASQTREIKDDTNEILNVVLKRYDNYCLYKETYYNNPAVKPINSLYPYYRVYRSSLINEKNKDSLETAAYVLFYKNVDGIISRNELDDMKERYKSWTLREWEIRNIKNKSIKQISIENKNENCEKTIRISEPLFTADMKKAIVIIASSKKRTGGDSGVTILKKEKGEWVVKGNIPIGVSD